MVKSHFGAWLGFHATVGLVSVRWNHGATHAQACGGRWVVGWVWWCAMRCSTGHGVVGASGSQAQHVRRMLWESWGTRGRSRAVMWVVCVGLASFGASSRVSGGTGPVTGGKGSCFEPVGA